MAKTLVRRRCAYGCPAVRTTRTIIAPESGATITVTKSQVHDWRSLCRARCRDLLHDNATWQVRPVSRQESSSPHLLAGKFPRDVPASVAPGAPQLSQPNTEPRDHKPEADDRDTRPNPREKRPLISEIFSRSLCFINRRMGSLFLHRD